MNDERLLNAILLAGTLLLESGAEIRRVEDTMVRMARNRSEVLEADSYVTLTGIMFSMTTKEQTYTKICRVHSGKVNLNQIDRINNLSRKMADHIYSIDQIEEELNEIKNEKRIPFYQCLLFSAISASAFSVFFDGGVIEALIAFFIGLAIRIVNTLCEKYRLNAFLNTACAAGMATLLTILIYHVYKDFNFNIVIISGFMLLVPGLAITNAIRDTIAGDTISGLARATDAFLCAVAIAAGSGIVLYTCL